MEITCQNVQDRLLEVIETANPANPDNAHLEKLRLHARECPTCRRECESMLGFGSILRVGLALNPTTEDHQVADRVVAARLRREISEQTGESRVIH